MSSGRGALVRRWVPVVVTLALVVVGYVLATGASSGRRCCDAVAYLAEAQSILDGAIELLPVHNYGYAGFLAILEFVGLGDALGIALVQTTLLYASVLVAALIIGRATRSSVAIAAAWLSATALLPAAAWSGLVFAEGLAAPMLFLVLALAILTIYRVVRQEPVWPVVIALGLACGMAWMARPALIWIPAAVGFIVLVVCVYVAWRGHRGALLLPLGFAVSVMLVAAPQFQFDDPLKTRFSEVHRQLAPLTFRWATGLPDSGPVGIQFTPIPMGEEWDETTTRRRALGSRQYKATAMVAHLVSGWDARPSPAYVYEDTGSRWIVVSAFSGFFIVGVLAVAVMVWQRRREWMEPDTMALGSLLLIFAGSQAFLAMSAAEFRFNIAGWLVAGFCLTMISALRWWTPRRAAAALVLGAAISGAVILLGQLTLLYSEWWLEYMSLIG